MTTGSRRAAAIVTRKGGCLYEGGRLGLEYGRNNYLQTIDQTENQEQRDGREKANWETRPGDCGKKILLRLGRWWAIAFVRKGEDAEPDGITLKERNQLRCKKA